MNDYDRLIALGFNAEDVKKIQFKNEKMTAVLTYYDKLKSIGLDHKVIIHIVYYKDKAEKLFENLYQYAGTLKNFWGISSFNLDDVYWLSSASELLPILCKYQEQLKGLGCTFEELRLMQNPVLCIELLCNHSNELSALSITKTELSSITEPYKDHLETKSAKFFQDAEVILKRLKIPLADWVLMSGLSYEYIQAIIHWHERILRLSMFSTDQLVHIKYQYFGLGQRMSAMCNHYEKLVELKLDSTDLLYMIANGSYSLVEFIETLVKYAEAIIELHFSPKEICLLSKFDSGKGIQILCVNRNELKQLGIVHASNLIRLAQLGSSTRAIKNVRNFQRFLDSQLQVKEPNDLIAIAGNQNNGKALQSMVDHLAPIKKFGFNVVADIVTLLSHNKADQIIETIAQHSNNLISMGITSDRLVKIIQEDDWQPINLEPIAKFGLVFKNNLKFTTDQLLQLLKAKCNAPITLKFLHDNHLLFTRVPITRIMSIFSVNNAGADEKEKRLRKLTLEYPSTSHVPQQQSSISGRVTNAVVQNQPEQRVEASTTISSQVTLAQVSTQLDLNQNRFDPSQSLIHTQSLALAELTKANENLLRENAALKEQIRILGKKRPNEASLEDNDSELLAADTKRATTSFFKRN